jgi:hypothetical protein
VPDFLLILKFGRLKDPLLSPEDEREGYVPNVCRAVRLGTTTALHAHLWHVWIWSADIILPTLLSLSIPQQIYNHYGAKLKARMKRAITHSIYIYYSSGQPTFFISTLTTTIIAHPKSFRMFHHVINKTFVLFTE